MRFLLVKSPTKGLNVLKMPFRCPESAELQDKGVHLRLDNKLAGERASQLERPRS
jgi:hypothetical protein